MKNNKIDVFYDNRMVLLDDSTNISKSPSKPKRLMEFINENNLHEHFVIKPFEPFNKEDFYTAHYKEYVDGFFNGIEPYSNSNGLEWSEQFADTVRYTNASLYNAILNSIKNPDTVSFSPTAGFHHAEPDQGFGFCTFSGQVISSLKIYREFGLSGAYLDLDGHFGNSIEGSRYFTSDLNKAIPIGCNINPDYTGKDYVLDLKLRLKELKVEILEKRIHYVVFCHGADSHIADDFGRQCTTEEWLECSKIVYTFIKDIETEMGKPFPLSLSLFGGYRKDDYNSVLSLHLGDLVECLNTLCGNNIEYKVSVKPKN
jgi:acetoin utilization deacetylase AcuC-like enzyme